MAKLRRAGFGQPPLKGAAEETQHLVRRKIGADDCVRCFLAPQIPDSSLAGPGELDWFNQSSSARSTKILSNQIAVEDSAAEPVAITRAKRFIEQNQGGAICLATVAKSVNTSTFYFCKLFKRATGLTFTEYLARVRIEKAKTLLLDSNRRVSEVAYEVGFESLTHFNRVFRKIVGQSPTAFRAELPAGRRKQGERARSSR